MPAQPLTHHEIFELVEPFTRSGRHVNLAASNRLDRRLVFTAIEHPDDPTLGLGLSEHLELYSYGTGSFLLTRVVTLANGLQARLEAVGPEPGALLEQVDAAAPQRHFRCGEGYTIARSYLVDAATSQLILTDADVQLDGLRLMFTLSKVRGVSADITLTPESGDEFDVPADLLAVLGWDWARLVPTRTGWRTRLRLRGNSGKRSRNSEIALDRAASHLALTLAEPPGCFHERYAAARWGVFLRRGIPLFTFITIVIAALALPHFARMEGSELWVLFFQVPTALIALSFSVQELPQYEIPPIPRRSGASSWRRPQASGVPTQRRA